MTSECLNVCVRLFVATLATPPVYSSRTTRAQAKGKAKAKGAKAGLRMVRAWL